MTATDHIRDDFDSPWKEALEHYFPEFLALLYPRIHAGIDWSKGHEFLDKELQQVVRDAELGRRYADKLVKVQTREGQETWVLVHVEVQGAAQAGFAERMYVYHYRLFDRYRVDIVSLAVLADDTPGFWPRSDRRCRWGCHLFFRFPVQKLLDWHARWDALEASPNPFGVVVMAHLKAQESKDGASRKYWKWRLMRLLYQRGYARESILELFRVIDWMLRLPDALEREFMHELIAFEEQAKMPYITSVERFSRQEGHQEGRQEGRQEGEAIILLRLIALKFSSPDSTLSQRIQRADSRKITSRSSPTRTDPDTADAVQSRVLVDLRGLQARMPQAGPQAQPFRPAREDLCRSSAACLRRTRASEGCCVTSVSE